MGKVKKEPQSEDEVLITMRVSVFLTGSRLVPCGGRSWHRWAGCGQKRRGGGLGFQG